MMLHKSKKGHFFNVLYCLGQLLTFGIAGLKAAGSFFSVFLYMDILFICLQRLRHENLINLIEVFRKRRKLYLVFEYVDHTVLEELEDHPKGLPSDTARSHVFQVLRGIEFCHQNNVSF